MDIKYSIFFIISLIFSSSAYSMEWMSNLFTKMTVENKELKTVYLVDELVSRVELDIIAACLSPKLQRIINEEQHKARVSGKPWDGIIWCNEIDRSELTVIKQVLETMYVHAQHSSDQNRKLLNSDLQGGGQEAVNRWSTIIKEYLFPHNEALQSSMFKNNRLNERYQAVAYFELPLLQQIIKKEAGKEIQGKSNSLKYLPEGIWAHHIFPYLTEDRDLKQLKSKMVSEAAKKLPYTLISRSELKTKAIAISEKNNVMAVGYENGLIQILDMKLPIPQEITSFDATDTSITTMSFSVMAVYLPLGLKQDKSNYGRRVTGKSMQRYNIAMV